MSVTIRISPKAWMKMQTLVMGYDKEVGWFGTCEELGPLEFRIKDILIFPQYTSGCFVDDERDDPLEFRKWLNTLSDEDYEQRRLWGHSHVNMGTYPSGTDNDMFKRFAQTSCAALVNRFAICLILNKRCDMYWWVYDGATDKSYEKKEINVMIEVDDDGTTNLEYFEGSKSLVRDIRPTTAFLYNRGYGSAYSSYGGSSFGANHEKADGYNYGGYNKYIDERNKETTTTPIKTTTTQPAKVTNPPVKVVDPPKTSCNWYDDLDDEILADYYGYAGYRFGNDDPEDYVPIEAAKTYEIEISESDVKAYELFDENSVDYKNDIVFEDEVSGDIYKVTLTSDTFADDHPVSKDTILMAMLNYAIDNGLSYFSIWENDTDGEHIISVSPTDNKNVLDMFLSPYESVNIDYGVIEFTLLDEDKKKGGTA